MKQPCHVSTRSVLCDLGRYLWCFSIVMAGLCNKVDPVVVDLYWWGRVDEAAF